MPAATLHNLDQTLALGQLLGQLAPPHTCIALSGPLGAGKTTLTRAIAQGAKVHDLSLVSSPTYVLLNIYPGPKPIYHLDAYRIASEEDFAAVGLEEILREPALVLIEWPDKIRNLLPPDRLQITLESLSEESRGIAFHPTGPKSAVLFEKLNAAVVDLWKASGLISP